MAITKKYSNGEFTLGKEIQSKSYIMNIWKTEQKKNNLPINIKYYIKTDIRFSAIFQYKKLRVIDFKRAFANDFWINQLQLSIV